MSDSWRRAGEVPLPPKNLQVVSPYFQGALDLRWEDPALLAKNSGYTIVGVNIYRSEASDLGPYRRINDLPVGGNFYRDRTDYVSMSEAVTWNGGQWLFKGDAPNDRRWVLKTRSSIVKRFDVSAFQKPTWASVPADVQLFIDGEEVPVAGVLGRTGEITLINAPVYNQVTERWEDPVLPTETSSVEVVYYTPKNRVKSGLEHNIWYRVVSVAVDSSTPSGYVETPLEWAEPKSVIQVEELDYIWREAMRRNAWILQQGGERCRFFIRKTSGVDCTCGLDERTLEYSKQPRNDCTTCYGTGYVGGYEGPYQGILVPDDAERRIAQSMTGRHKEHTYEVWMGPSPLLTQRDFVVKQTNERYSIGAVRRPTHRGNLLQQHFNIRYLDQGDIRYSVPMDGTTDLNWPETRGQGTGPGAKRVYSPRPVDGALEGEPQWPTGPDNMHPLNTEKSNIPDERERRGRTRVWENTEYGILWWVLPPALAALSEAGYAFSGVV